MRQTNYDSEFCGKVPIHLTNLIQPYGILLVVEAGTESVVQASENTPLIFEQTAEQLVNSSLKDLLNERNYLSLKAKLSEGLNDKIPGTWELNGRHYLVLIHRKPDQLLIEIDARPLTPGKQDSFIEVYQELKYAMSSLESTSTLAETCQLAARELKRISGFDKVMIYQFDLEWNGTVIAEEREQDMESYYGFTFPASDIPKQARALYLKNPYRFIPDRNYEPVRLFPVVNPLTGSFLDLSDCNLRSVAAVHVEYLKNMGVVASMSTRILHHDKLWGLIACHHKTPMYASYEMCSIFEMLSSIISVKITSMQNEVRSDVENNITATYSHLIESVYRSQDLTGKLLSDSGVLRLFSATGAVISKNGKFLTIGVTPRTEQLEELLLWLHTREIKKVYHTDQLGAEYEYARDYASEGSGMLVIPINYLKDSYLIVFRPERVQMINWGGNPDERIVFDQNEKNYHPRNSFKQWQQKVHGIALPWRKEEIDIAETLRSFIYEYETSLV